MRSGICKHNHGYIWWIYHPHTVIDHIKDQLVSLLGLFNNR
jgi:hypothetical protein